MNTIWKKKCKCGNVCIVRGSVDLEHRQTDITTENENGEYTCSMYANTGITCLCGKDYRMFDRQAWHMTALNPTPAQLEKELHRLQRDLNSHRLLDYIPGDQSEQEQARQQERASKLARFNEILNTLHEVKS